MGVEVDGDPGVLLLEVGSCSQVHDSQAGLDSDSGLEGRQGIDEEDLGMRAGKDDAVEAPFLPGAYRCDDRRGVEMRGVGRGFSGSCEKQRDTLTVMMDESGSVYGPGVC